MTTVILARLRAGLASERQRSVHVFRIEVESGAETLIAYCGFRIPGNMLEPMSELAGMPCLVRGSVDRSGLPPADPRLAELPGADEPDSADRDDSKLATEREYLATARHVVGFSSREWDSSQHAIGLRGEPEWHDVAPNPLINTYEGRPVVITECGRMGWLRPGDPPEGWQRCSGCAESQRG